MKALQAAFLITVLALALTGTASAGTFANGSVSFTEVVLSYVGANLPVATSVTLDTSGATPPGRVNSATGLPFNCPQVGCSPSQADPGPPPIAQLEVITSPTTFNVPLTALLLQWGDGTNLTRYSFTETSSSASSAGANTVAIFANGTFADSLGIYNTNAATLIMNLTQADGPGNTISLAGTIATQAAPEPATMAMLGSALLCLGLIGRKRFTR